MLYRSLTAGLILAAGAFAQLTSFPKPSYFRETFAKTETRVQLRDPVKLPDYVVGDKLELSLKNYLALVMANNTDIQLQMLTVETPKNAITRAFGAWDPLAAARFSSTRTTSPSTNALDGATTLNSLSQPAQFSYAQTLPTGTQYTVSFAGTKSTTNSGLQNFNPSLATSMAINFTQPLLRNRGSYVNKLGLMTARSRLRVSEYGLRSQLLTLVSSAENAYWDVILARESLKVAEGGLNVAQEFLKLSQKQLDLGALSPLDIFNPQQQVAQNELNVSQSRYTLQQREDALRKQIGADLDPKMRALPIVLTETVDVPSSGALDANETVAKALLNRPDLKAAVQNLDVDDLSIRSARNGLLPNLALTGTYSSQGRGGIFYQRSNVTNVINGGSGSVSTIIPGGFSDSLDQLFSFGYPVYGFGVTLSLPIKNHQATADLADAVVQKKRDALNVRTTEQQVRLDILNAVSTVEGAKDSVKLARTVRDLAQKNYEAEQKKYELGTEQNQFVLQAQNALVSAESSVVVNLISLRKSTLNLLMRTGELLDERGIVVQ